MTKKASTSRLNSSTSNSQDGSIKVGYVRRAHGIRGAVIVRVLGDEVEQFGVGCNLATDSEKHPELTVVSAHPHREGLLVAFEGVTDRNESETLRGASFLIALEDRRSLDDDEFWPEQLIGLQVVDPAGVRLGVIAELVSGGPQDRLMVETEQGIFAVPFVAAIVRSVDIAAGLAVVDAPAGLLDPEGTSQ